LGGKLHLRLNINGKPIANKYSDGKMKRTLKRELKVPEIVQREKKEACVFNKNIYIYNLHILYIYIYELYSYY